MRESESHQCPWMNEVASRLEEMAIPQAQQKGKEDFACLWISDLIFKSKGQRKVKQNNVKIKEGILTGPVSLKFEFLLHLNKESHANPYRNHLLGNAVKSVHVFGWFLFGFRATDKCQEVRELPCDSESQRNMASLRIF